MIPWVFNFSFIITFMNFTIVPWEPLSLWLVPLVLVNSSHQWPVIRWFSSMFNCDTFTHMLEFILWSSQDAVEDTESCLIWLRLRGVMCYSWLYRSCCYTDGCHHTMGLYIYDDPSISDSCIHALDLRLHMILLYWMVMPMAWVFSYSPYHPYGCIHTVDSWYQICMCICVLDL